MDKKGTEEEFEDMRERLISQEAVSFRNMDNDARKRFLDGNYLKDAIQSLMEQAKAANAILYIRAAVDGQWATLAKQLAPSEFERWMKKTFVGANGKFYIDYTDKEQYSLTDGDTTHVAPAFVFDQLQVSIAQGKHKDGGNFSKWYYIGTNQDIKKWIRERYQIADHPPTARDKDLMVPCVIHAILLHDMDENDRLAIQDFLYTRQRTRFLLMSSLAIFAEEMNSRVHIYGLDGKTIQKKFSPSGLKYWDPNPQNKQFFGFNHASLNTKKDGLLFNKPKETTFLDRKALKIGIQEYKLVLWDDHVFILEQTPFGCNSAQLIDRLMKARELKPINLLQRNVFSITLPFDYIPQSMYYSPTYLANPELVKKLDMTPPWTTKPEPEEEWLKDITLQNIGDRIDDIDDRYLSKVGYRLFVNELINQGLNDVMAVSGPLKYFLKQSIHGGSFSIATRPIVEGGVIMLDRNSNHPFAFSQIDFPRGNPKRFPTKNCDTKEKLFAKPIFCIDCEAEYIRQHPLDYPSFKKRMIINNIDARNPAIRIGTIYRGYYWDNVAKTPAKALLQSLYALRPAHPKIKKVLNTLYGKLIQKPNLIIPHPSVGGDTIDNMRTSPLIRNIIQDHDRIISYHYYNDIDYKYNYTMIASLLLAQQRKNMRDVFTFCQQHQIQMYYSAVDSLAIPEKDFHYFEEAGMIGKELGQFKIEARNDVAVFVRKGLYYCGMKKITTSLGDKVSYENVYDIWQYSSAGLVSGISGNVDLDIMYIEESSAE